MRRLGTLIEDAIVSSHARSPALSSLRLGDFALLDKVLLLEAGIRHSPEVADQAREGLLLHIAAIKDDVRRLAELLTGDVPLRTTVPVPASIRASQEGSRECCRRVEVHRTLLRLSVYKYLAELRSERPYELVFGVPRPAPAPTPSEVSAIVDRLMLLLSTCRGGAGDRFVAIRSPVDVVLDIENGLVLHPAIAVVRQAQGVVRAERQIWRAPALVIEVLWPACARRIRRAKVRWYRNYGVEECWLVDTRYARIEVLDFAHGSRFVPYVYRDEARIQSHLYPDADVRAADVFGGIVTRNRWLSRGRVR